MVINNTADYSVLSPGLQVDTFEMWWVYLCLQRQEKISQFEKIKCVYFENNTMENTVFGTDDNLCTAQVQSNL